VHQLERQHKRVFLTDVRPSVAQEIRQEPWFREQLLVADTQEALKRSQA